MKKIVVVGFGFMGVIHSKNILAAENLELSAIIDNRDEDIFDNIEHLGNNGKIDLKMEQLKRTPVYKTLEECCEKVKPDAVVICVPLYLHYQLAKTALSIGLDVLLEKPFCSDIKQGLDLIELAEKQKRILMIAHCIRFSPEWSFLAKCIQDQRYGKLTMLSTNRISGVPTWGVWKKAKIKETCGGALMDLIIHDVDFAISCLGKSNKFKINFIANEYYELSLNYDEKPCAISIKGGFLHQNSPFVSEFTGVFENASIRYSSLEPSLIHIGKISQAETVVLKGDAYSSELKYFTDCIVNRNKPEKCMPMESLEAVKLCLNIKKNVQQSKKII
jgi:predicted dehydrogenase